ncbi:hypothetical protein M885DRAFT_558257 [Pelagophyceae sp. CCMP2097]|nr:hypothetical protein M885DRAFT_558257 [Pelagophyceae sp. CCMP2097]
MEFLHESQDEFSPGDASSDDAPKGEEQWQTVIETADAAHARAVDDWTNEEAGAEPAQGAAVPAAAEAAAGDEASGGSAAPARGAGAAPPAPGPSYALSRAVGWGARSAELLRVQAFESVRRRAFGRELLASYTHWAALDAMVRRSTRQVAAARKFFQKRLEAEQAYAKALAEMERLPLEMRAEAIDVGGGARLGADDEAMETVVPPSVAELCAAQQRAAGVHALFAKTVKEGCLDVLHHLEGKATAAAKHLRKAGDAALARAGKAAKAVEVLFEAYVATAAESHANADGGVRSASRDMWLADAQYRVGAALLNAAWAECAAQLAALFAGAQALEVERRATVHDVEQLFVDSQRGCWVALGATLDGAAAAVTAEAPADAGAVGRAVGAELRATAAQLTAQRRAAAMAGGADSTGGADARDVVDRAVQAERQDVHRAAAEAADPEAGDLPEALPSLGSPLVSPLVLESLVVARQVSNTLGVQLWRTCLAVATADGFVHIYDAADVAGDVDAETAFAAVAPTQPRPAAFSLARALRGEAGGARADAPLRPTLSIDLAATSSERQSAPVQRGGSLVCVEAIAHVGARAVFNKQHLRTVRLAAHAKHAPAFSRLAELARAAPAPAPPAPVTQGPPPAAG